MFNAQSKDAMRPLVFAIVKALTPDDFKIDFFDERIEKLPENINADYIFMTVETFSAKRAYLLAQHYKKQGKKVIMGGFHPTACSDEAMQHADSVIIGELESVWANVLEDIKNNNLKSFYQGCSDFDLSDIELDYSVFNNKKYAPVDLIQFSRGCKFACEFCSVHSFFKNTIRTKSIEKILEEVKNTKQKFLFFIDDNLFSDEKKAIELFSALIPLKKKWCCQISIDIAKKPELLMLMRQAGCFMILIGFESLDIENLKQMKKGANIQNNNYDEIIKNIYNAGLMIYGTFVIGYDNDTKDTAKQLMEFAIKYKFAIANFNPLMPMPDTKLYERLKQENRLTFDKWWLDDDYHYGDAMLRPKKMTELELVESCKQARYCFNTYFNIFRRLMNFKSNCSNVKNIFFFLLANFVSRFEIHSKQGKKLGGEI